MTTRYPPAYLPYECAVESLPEPVQIPVSEDVTLETLHVDGPDPTIVFVHGGLGSLWNPYVQLAALDGECGLISYALAGNGASSERLEHTLDGHVKDLRDLLTELGVDRPVVHGHSYGTTIALEYAKQYSPAGLVLTGGGDHDLAAPLESIVLRAVSALRLYNLPHSTPLVRGLCHRIVCHDATPQAVAVDFARSNPLPKRRSAWRTPTAFHGYDGRKDADRVDVPTLVLHGTGDEVVPSDIGRGTAARLPRATFFGIERTGHVPFVERPGTYNELLRGFVAVVRGQQSFEELRDRGS